MRVLAGVVLWIGLAVGMTAAGAALMNQLNEQTSVPAQSSPTVRSRQRTRCIEHEDHLQGGFFPRHTSN